MPKFTHHDLRLLNPTFDSPLLDVVQELEYLRRLEISGTTPPGVFFQLKDVFHILESLSSARIEGNHTTLADFVEAKVHATAPTDSLREILNIEAAMKHVEEVIKEGAPITESFIRGLHAKTVSELVREGDRTPGAYRTGQVKIAQANHLPPSAILVPTYMQELASFINKGDPKKYDLMKVALAHHRFSWIHPFGNGNGRVVRLLTYAMLIKYGFQVNSVGPLVNPAAIFCADRSSYYQRLAYADTGESHHLENWCLYVLEGLATELKKVEQLANYSDLRTKILLPAVAYARERVLITQKEETILNVTVRKGIIKAGDLAAAMPKLNSAQRTYQIRKLLESGMLQQTEANSRQYTIGFTNNTLLRGVVRALEAEGFIPAALKAPVLRTVPAEKRAPKSSAS